MLSLATTGSPIDLVKQAIWNILGGPGLNILVANLGLTITSPAEDKIFQGTNPIPVSAVALLAGGSITNVNFFVDGVPFGQDGTAPFSATWSNVVGGSHRLTAALSVP